jgi:hypothetical protein
MDSVAGTSIFSGSAAAAAELDDEELDALGLNGGDR